MSSNANVGSSDTGQVDDEQKFQLWMEKFENSVKKCSEDSLSDTDIINATKIQALLAAESSSYPSWVASTADFSGSLNMGKLTSSAADMKVYLRHVAFPNVFQCYEQFMADLRAVTDTTAITTTTDNDTDEFNDYFIAEDSSSIRKKPLLQQQALIPIHTNPLSTNESNSANDLKQFFTNISEGKLDGVIGLCRLADLHHRINRAATHDYQQVQHWQENEKARHQQNEQSRVEHEHKLSLVQLLGEVVNHSAAATSATTFSTDPAVNAGSTGIPDNAMDVVPAANPNIASDLTVLDHSGADSSTSTSTTGGELSVVHRCVRKLKTELDVLTDKLTEAERAEEEAKKVYEAAIQHRKSVTSKVETLENYVDSVHKQRELLTRIYSMRLEVDNYNTNSAKARLRLFDDLSQYLRQMRSRFISERLRTEIPLVFQSLADMINNTLQHLHPKPTTTASTTILNDRAEQNGATSRVATTFDLTEADATAHATNGVVADGVGALDGTSTTIINSNSNITTSGNENNNGSIEDITARLCSIRASLETIRVWRQLNSNFVDADNITGDNTDVVFAALSDKITQFEQILTKRLQTLQNNTTTASATTTAGLSTSRISNNSSTNAGNNAYKFNNDTVVLYFDHIHHDTPDEHVEGQSRVQTCLRMLVERIRRTKKAAKTANAGVSTTQSAGTRTDLDPMQTMEAEDAMDIEAVAVKPKVSRIMQLLSCNDVIAPPMWCLPLVHSPQYLAHLWRLAEAAQRGDYYVPLEFDTEWHSDDPYRHGGSDDDADKQDRRKNHSLAKLKKTFMASDGIGKVLGDSKQREQFLKHMTPAAADIKLAKVIGKLDAKNPVVKNSKSRNSSYSTNNTNNNSNRQRSRGGNMNEVPVETAYGMGLLIATHAASATRPATVLEVKLEWGAIGYFREDSVTIVSVSDGEDDRRSNKTRSGSGHTTSSNYNNNNGNASAVFLSPNDKRFLRTDLKLHKIMSQLVMRVKIQRNIAQLVGLNHASLSLWMHGRTSTGLNRGIQKQINKWLAKYDRAKVEQLIKDTEDDDFNAPNYATLFMDRLMSLRTDTSDEGANNNTTEPEKMEETVGDSDEYDSDDINSDEGRLEAIKYSVDKCQKKAGNNIKANVTTRISSNAKLVVHATTVTAAVNRTAASNKPVAGHMKNTNTLSQHQSTILNSPEDSMLLRQLLLSIMKTLRVSQGNLASDYYKNFREETSQGAVSSWFHHRGKPPAYDRMSRCGLLWLDDHKKYLSTAERKKFVDLYNRVFAENPASAPASSSCVASAARSANSRTATTAPSAKRKTAACKTASLVDINFNDDESISVQSRSVVDDDSNVYFEDTDRKRAAQGNLKSSQAVVGAGSSSGLHSAVSDSSIQTIGDLHAAVSLELKRRRISQSKAAVEANLKLVGLGQPALSKFLSIATVTNNARGRDFCHLMLRWLMKSTGRLPVSGDVSAGLTSNRNSSVSLTKLSVADANEQDRGDDLDERSISESGADDMEVDEEQQQQDDNADDNTDDNVNGMDDENTVDNTLDNAPMEQNTESNAENEEENDMENGVENDSDDSNDVSAEDEADDEQAAAVPCEHTAVAHSVADVAVIEPESADDNNNDSIADSSNDDNSDDDTMQEERKYPHNTNTAAADTVAVESNNTEEYGENDSRESHSSRASSTRHSSMTSAANSTHHLQSKNASANPDASETTTVEDSAHQPLTDTNNGVVATSDKQTTAQASDNDNDTENDSNKRKANEADEYERPKRMKVESSSSIYSGGVHVSDQSIIEADTYEPGFHYDACEVCKEPRGLSAVSCHSCPCVYHNECLDTSKTTKTDRWFCAKCRESSAHTAKVMPREQKLNKNMDNIWLLVYSALLHRWRKAVVVMNHPERDGVLQLKWWRSDNRGGKTNWVDITKAKILLYTQEKTSSSSNSSIARSKSQQAIAPTLPLPVPLNRYTSASSQLSVKFDAEPKKKTYTTTNSKTSKFRATGKGMLMDGDSSGGMTPAAFAAAAGYGGVGALLNAEEDDVLKSSSTLIGNGMSDTYISSNSLRAALCAAGTGCRAVDIVMTCNNTNVFACTRPPGHHAGRYGCTSGCLSTGFCILNNAAVAAVYARVRYGLERVAVVDIDVHFGNGTAELLKNDPGAFFASVHMIYGEDNDGLESTSEAAMKSRAERAKKGFYPALLGQTEITPNYVSVGVLPSPERKKLRGSRAYSKPAATQSDSDDNDEDGDDDEGGESIAPSVDAAAALISATEHDDGTVATADNYIGMSIDAHSTSPVASSDVLTKLEDATTTAATSTVVEANDDKIMQVVKVESALNVAAVDAIADAVDTTRNTMKSVASNANFNNGSASSGAGATNRKPLVGAEGYFRALKEIIIPQMEQYRPQLLIISAGFDGFRSDPLGGELCLSLQDFTAATKLLMHSMNKISELNGDGPQGRVVSILEGGYDTSPNTLGLAHCVDTHVAALQDF